MRFVFVTHSEFSRNPVNKRSVGTGEGLAVLGHDVYIIVKDCDENRSRMAKEAPHCKAMFIRGGILREIFAKLAALWRIRPDVIFISTFSVHNLACLSLLFPNAKSIVEFCELYSQFPKRCWKWAVWELIAVFEHKYILCASNYLKDHFSRVCRKYFLKRHIVYSPYAYPTYLSPIESVHKKKTILFMAGLGKGYGVHDVVHAFEIVARQRDDVSLEIIGKGEEYEPVLAWVKEHKLADIIHLRGYVAESDLNGYFSIADVFVSPMHDTIQDWARCPSKIFYYIPYQKPIVTCQIGNPYDVLGEYGFYYKPDDVNDMARSILRAIEASGHFSYPNGFVEKHSWSARAKELEEWMRREG